MGTISEKLTYLNGTKQKLKQKINNLGGTIDDNTTFRQYANQLQTIYDNLPKTEYQEGTEITLSNTLKGKLDYENGVVGIGQASQKILPNEYQEVEYIESSGTQYINTGITGKNLHTAIESKCTWSSIGGGSGVASTGGLHYINDNVIRTGGSAEGYHYTLNEIVVVKAFYNAEGKRVVSVNGEIVCIGTAYSSTDANVLINSLADGAKQSGKIFWFKIYNDDVLVYHAIPCYRKSDSVIGMYDIVNNTFYTNSGTGTFTKGADAPTPNQEIPINSVTGNQDVVVSGKNLLNIADFREHYTLGSDGLPMYNSAQTRIANMTPIIVEGIEKVTMTFTNRHNGAFMYSLLKADNTLITRTINNYSNTTITIGQAKYLYICFYDNATLENVTDAMLVEGDTGATYEPYITPTSYQLSLGDIELNAIGNYKDELVYDVDEDRVYKNKAINKKIIDGTEGWQDSDITSVAYTNIITDYATSNNIPYCTHFKGENNCNGAGGMQDYGDNSIAFMQVSGSITPRLYIKKIGITTLQLRTLLAEIKPIFYYALETEVKEEITGTLKDQVKALYNAHSLNGTTIITSNGDLPMIIKCRALKGE